MVLPAWRHTTTRSEVHTLPRTRVIQSHQATPPARGKLGANRPRESGPALPDKSSWCRWCCSSRESCTHNQLASTYTVYIINRSPLTCPSIWSHAQACVWPQDTSTSHACACGLLPQAVRGRQHSSGSVSLSHCLVAAASQSKRQTSLMYATATEDHTQTANLRHTAPAMQADPQTSCLPPHDKHCTRQQHAASSTTPPKAV